MGSDHLPIVIYLFNKSVISSSILLNNNDRIQKDLNCVSKILTKNYFLS